MSTGRLQIIVDAPLVGLHAYVSVASIKQPEIGAGSRPKGQEALIGETDVNSIGYRRMNAGITCQAVTRDRQASDLECLSDKPRLDDGAHLHGSGKPNCRCRQCGSVPGLSIAP